MRRVGESVALEVDDRDAEFERAESYRSVLLLDVLQGLLVLLTGGLWGLMLLWWVRPRFWLRRRCTIAEASHLLIGTPLILS